MRRLTFVFSVLVAVAMLAASQAGANLLDDGAFDLATSGSTTSNSDWSLVINLPDGTNRAAQFQTGFANANNTGVGGTQAPGTGAGVWFRAFEGNQGGSGEPLAQATLTQSLVAPANSEYRLDFVAGRETFFTAQEFSVTLASDGGAGSTTVDLLTAAIPTGNLGGAASTNPGGTPFSLTLSGVAAGDLLTVTGVMVDGVDALTNPQSAYLDSFVLTAVPEPSTVALTLLGAVGGLALVRRRR